MKEDSAHDMDSLKELLTDRGMSDWPSRSSNTEEIYDARNDIDLTELEAFFHYDVVQDKHDKSRHMLSVGRASLPVLHGGVLASTDDLTEWSDSLVREQAKSHTGGKQAETRNVHVSSGSTAANDTEDDATDQDFTWAETRIVQAYQSYVKAVISTMKSLASVESLEIAKEIIRFETKLARLTEAGAGAQRKTAIYTTLRRLNNKYLSVSFSANLLKRNLRKKGIRIEDDTKIYIAEPAYVENVFTLLRKTRRYKVKNYVGWKIIATIAPFVSPLRPHHQKFMAQYGFQEKRKEDICTESVAAKGSALQPLISQLYVERKFSPEAKNDVQLMTQLIQRELVAELRNSRWTSHEARRTALKAVTEMDKVIGYPDWMDDKAHLAGLFSNVRNFTTQSSFVRIYEEYRMAAFENSMKKLSSPFSASDEWSGAPMDVTFGYDASSNLIYMPVGVLQPPLYSPHYPRAVNYGTVGVMIAREMAQAFNAPDLQSVSDKKICPKITLDDYYERKTSCPSVRRDDEESLPAEYEDFREEILDEIALRVSWKAYLTHTDKLKIASNADTEDETRKQKLFLHSAGVFLCTVLSDYDIRKCETDDIMNCRMNHLMKMPEFR
ncbi:neprilysin-2-like isoform X1 [Dermacentor silvarum]|uniref:neprilysin-2-like isoform X1 n=1 Tax=Dermacentor silvarum TaxID=543639 RepID=UPI00210114A1|nr:neprilysin-2-like isoform X1 [Dermacentor silvarum]